MALRKAGVNPSKFQKNQIKYLVILLPVALFMALPIIFIFNHAFKPMDELFAFPPTFFVRNFSWENFENLIDASQIASVPLSRYVFNSLVVTVMVVSLSVIIATLAGYILSKKQFKGKHAIMEINNAALMFVPIAVAIPRYLIISFTNIDDTYFAHILPLIAMPVGLFLIKQFVDQVPDELIEAAIIDGATEWQIYRRIILPLIKPATATAALLAFQAVWNNIETSQLYITSDSMRTLAFYMNTFAANTNLVVGQGMAAAASLIMFLPNLVLFIVLQSQVMNTMSHSGLK